MSVDVLDTADWDLVAPVLQLPGEAVNIDGRLTLVLVAALGGPARVALTSDGPEPQLRFVADPIMPYIAIKSSPATRTLRLTRGALDMGGDLYREVGDGTRKWLARVELRVLMGSDSPEVAKAAGFPVLLPSDPYGGVSMLPLINVGPQGAGVPPAPALGRYVLVAVDGVIGWAAA